MGSSAAFHLAQRGAHILGLDRFTPPHSSGSSHGQTRIIREAYFEHPDYGPVEKLIPILAWIESVIPIRQHAVPDQAELTHLLG